MKFEYIQPKNKKIESDELIEDLLCVAQQIGKAPTMGEYNRCGKYEATVYCRRFGSWNKALLKAGLTINNKEWTEVELFQNIEKVWTHLGRQPTRRDMDKEYSEISSGAYTRHYKTWLNALKAFVSYVNSDDIELVTYKTLAESTHKTARDINLRLRFKVLQRDNFKCCICGRSPSTTIGLQLHIDHIIPYSKGGETVIENLQTLCFDCNLGKGNLI